MILGKNTLKFGLYAAIGAVLLTLMNFFNQVQANEIIVDILNLGQMAIYAIFVGIAFVAAQQRKERGVPSAVVNGAIAALVVGIALAILMAITENVDVRFMFRNLQPLRNSALAASASLLEASVVAVASVLFVSLIAGFRRWSVGFFAWRVGIAAAAMLVLVIVRAGGELDSEVTGIWQILLQLQPYVSLILTALCFGVLGGLLTQMPYHFVNTATGVVLAATIIGVLQGQIDRIITLPDALTLLLAFGGGYVAARSSGLDGARERILIGAGIGLVVALVLGGLAAFTGMERGTILRGGGTLVPTILSLPLQGLGHAVIFGLALALLGAAGAATTTADRLYHNASWYIMSTTLSLGFLASQREVSLLTAGVIGTIFAITFWYLPAVGESAESSFEAMPTVQRRSTRLTVFAAGLVFVLVLPNFLGLSLSNTLNLMMIYIIMGVGMNVMIGFAGLLDLGYVASFAIGAYTTGLLTTPSLLTCGGLTAAEAGIAGGMTVEQIQAICPGVMTFWTAWPFAILVSALTGMALGVPVLRLRGDYLAIVTLGFGEIINRLVNSSVFRDLLGGPQGINGIPVPTVNLSFINPTWNAQLSRSTEIYYLFLFTVAVGTVVVLRLVNTRLGRAWRALRDDEDVAEATGIHLVGAKLLAFGISSAFSGMGGALFGASLQGIFPNSFTLQVSIFVLSLVIVGGMGSIPAVFVGAIVLIGLPEALRELQDYRLLAFGVLLVVVMLSKPEGILPPQTPKLSERATRNQPAPAAGD